MKRKNVDIEREIHLMKERNMEWKKSLEKDIENLSLRNQLLEKELLETKRVSDAKQMGMDLKIEAMRNEATENKNLSLEQEKNMNNQLSNEVNMLQERVKNVSEQSNKEIKMIERRGKE